MRWCFVMARGAPPVQEMKILVVALLILIPIVALLKRQDISTNFVAPTVQLRSNRVYFESHFESKADLATRWTTSGGRKQINSTHSVEYDGIWAVDTSRAGELDGDLALFSKSRGRHHAISSFFDKSFQLSNASDLIVQYEVAFSEPVTCATAHIKLLANSANLDLRKFDDGTPYTLLFGTEKCGGHYRMHLRLRLPSCSLDPAAQHSYSEFELDQDAIYIDRSVAYVDRQLRPLFSDRRFHLYTLALRQSSSERFFEIYIDQQLFHSAPLSSLKPVNVSGKESEQCDLIGNDLELQSEIAALGIELSSRSSNLAFDNFLVTDSRLVADEYARQTWLQKQLVAEFASDFYVMYDAVLEATADMPWLWTVTFVFLLLLVYYLYYVRPLLAEGLEDQDEYSSVRTLRLRAAAAAAARIQPIAILKSTTNTESRKPSRRVRFADETPESVNDSEALYAYAVQSTVVASHVGAT